MLEAGQRDEESSLSAPWLENAVTVWAEAISMVSLGQKLRWRRRSVELEGRKPLAVTAKMASSVSSRVRQESSDSHKNHQG